MDSKRHVTSRHTTTAVNTDTDLVSSSSIGGDGDGLARRLRTGEIIGIDHALSEPDSIGSNSGTQNVDLYAQCNFDSIREMERISRRTMVDSVKRLVDIIYTDVFLDIFNYERDKRYVFEDIFEFRPSEIVLMICAPEIYKYIYYVERSNVLFSGSVILISTAMQEYGFLPVTVDHVVLVNVDPFRVENESRIPGNTLFNRNRFRSFFNSFLARIRDDVEPAIEANTEKGIFYKTRVHLMYNFMTIGDGDVELYSTNTGLPVECCIRVSLVSRHDVDSTNSELLRFCNDPVECDGVYESFMVEQDIDPSLIRCGERVLRVNLVITLVVDGRDHGRTPLQDYLRLKRFYYSFVHNKVNRWGIMVRNDYGTFWQYIKSMNVCMRDDLKSAFCVLQRYVILHIIQNYSECGDCGGAAEFDKSFEGLQEKDDTRGDGMRSMVFRRTGVVDSVYMAEASTMLRQIYDSCPTILHSVNLKDIMWDTMNVLQRKVRDALGMMKHNIPLQSSSNLPNATDSTINRSYLLDSYKSFDTLTFPPGGNVLSTTVLFALNSRNLGAGDAYTVRQEIARNEIVSA